MHLGPVLENNYYYTAGVGHGSYNVGLACVKNQYLIISCGAIKINNYYYTDCVLRR